MGPEDDFDTDGAEDDQIDAIAALADLPAAPEDYEGEHGDIPADLLDISLALDDGTAEGTATKAAELKELSS